VTLIDIKGVDPRTLSKSELRQYRACMAAWYCYFHRDEIEYILGGPAFNEAIKHPPPTVPGPLDCSTFVTYCFAVAKALNPNTGGFGWDDYVRNNHNTGSLWKQGVLVGGAGVKEGKLRPGDLIFTGYSDLNNYGVGGVGEHVTIYVGRGIQISHGSDPGPLKLGWKDATKPLVGVRRYPW
jgi:cell wall-associated NlpC family hydrolase